MKAGWMVIALLMIAASAAGCELQQPATLPVPQTAEITPQQAQPSQLTPQQDNATTPEHTAKPELQEPHWTHMPVTYSLNEAKCGAYESKRVKRAFDQITNATKGVVTFKKAESPGQGDINITCTFLENCYKTSVDIHDTYVIRYETICQHDLGLTTTKIYGNAITYAHIELFGLAGFSETKYDGPSGFYVGTCGHTITEVHELLHAFGYKHSSDNTSIMYPDADTFGLTIRKSGECAGSDKAIGHDIAESLIATYQESNVAG